MIIWQRVTEQAGDTAQVARVLRVGSRLYVEVWQTADATERTLMNAVNRAIDTFILRCKFGRGYGTACQEGRAC